MPQFFLALPSKTDVNLTTGVDEEARSCLEDNTVNNDETNMQIFRRREIWARKSSGSITLFCSSLVLHEKLPQIIVIFP